MISVEVERCTGCKVCELACYFYKSGRFNTSKSRIQVVKMERIGIDNPVVCVQCARPQCVESCLENALVQGRDGVIELDEKKCVGCRLCVDACIIGAVVFDAERGIPLICDLCDGHPKCVQWCPTNALTFSTASNITARARQKRWETTRARAAPLLRKWDMSEKLLDQYGIWADPSPKK